MHDQRPRQFWHWLCEEARVRQHTKRTFSTDFAGIVMIGLTLIGTTWMPFTGTLMGAAIGGVVGAIVVSSVHKDKTFDRLCDLSDREREAFLAAMEKAYPDLTYRLACECLEDGVAEDLLNQIEASRIL